MDKILRIDASASGGPAVKTEALGDYAGLGGRAMTSTVVAKEVPPPAIRWAPTTNWSSHRGCSADRPQPFRGASAWAAKAR
jgi:hypothetical protein